MRTNESAKGLSSYSGVNCCCIFIAVFSHVSGFHIILFMVQKQKCLSVRSGMYAHICAWAQTDICAVFCTMAAEGRGIQLNLVV